MEEETFYLNQDFEKLHTEVNVIRDQIEYSNNNCGTNITIPGFWNEWEVYYDFIKKDLKSGPFKVLSVTCVISLSFFRYLRSHRSI